MNLWELNNMFKKRFENVCAEKGISPSAACKAIGLNASSYSKWDDNSIPRQSTVKKFADLLGVTVNDLLGDGEENEQTENTPEEPKLSEGEAMLLEAIRDVPEDQRPALLVELMRIALKNQK